MSSEDYCHPTLPNELHQMNDEALHPGMPKVLERSGVAPSVTQIALPLWPPKLSRQSLRLHVDSRKVDRDGSGRSATMAHPKIKLVEQNEVAFCDNTTQLLWTRGLGCCIGVCIAWNGWAGIIRSADIFADEKDQVASPIREARTVIRKQIIPRIRPVVLRWRYSR
jgi:hypothetical protein